MSEVFDAIAAGDVDRVRALAADDPRVGLVRKDGISAVLTARYHQRLELVEALMPDDDALDVWEAAALRRTSRLRTLLDEDPALVDATAADGFRPLALASFFGHEEGVRLLLERGAPTSAPRSRRRPLRARPRSRASCSTRGPIPARRRRAASRRCTRRRRTGTASCTTCWSSAAPIRARAATTASPPPGPRPDPRERYRTDFVALSH